MNSQSFRGSLAGMYFNKQRVEKINSSQELLNDYLIRRKKKKGWEGYINFLNANKSACLKIAEDILFIRKGVKKESKYETVNSVQVVEGVYHHYFN